MGYGAYDDEYWENRAQSRIPQRVRQWSKDELADIRKLKEMPRGEFLAAFTQADPQGEIKTIPLAAIVPQASAGMTLKGMRRITGAPPVDEDWSLYLRGPSGLGGHVEPSWWGC